MHGCVFFGCAAVPETVVFANVRVPPTSDVAGGVEITEDTVAVAPGVSFPPGVAKISPDGNALPVKSERYNVGAASAPVIALFVPVNVITSGWLEPC